MPVKKKVVHAAFDDAVERVYKDGLTIPEQPGDEVPTLPQDITLLDDRELMTLMAEHVAWLEYVGVRLARGEIEEREIDLAVVRRQSGLIIGSWGGKSSDRVRIARAEADADSELDELRQAHLTSQAYRKLLQNLYDSTERRVNLISRELTRRTSMEPAQKRVKRYGGA